MKTVSKIFKNMASTYPDDSFESKINIYYILLFVLCLITHVWYSSIGWHNPITDAHGFRQTHTAITSYYFITEGFKLDYITPVLGPPWSIPLEFPIYQIIVSIIAVIFTTPLDQTGRFVNLLFFYLSLVPLYALLGYFI